MKRLLIILFTLLIVISSPPVLSGFVVFADSIPSGYTQVTNRDQLVNSFLAYCKSRDSQLYSSVAAQTATYTYQFLQKTCEALGFSLTQLQAQLYYQNVNNVGLRFYMTSIGVQFYNDIFAYLIQQNGLEVGDSSNKIIDSGIYYTSAENYTSKVYVFQGLSNPYYGWSDNNHVKSYGSDYKYDYTEYKKPLTSGNFKVRSDQSRIITYTVGNNEIKLGDTGELKNIEVDFEPQNFPGFNGYTGYNTKLGENEDGQNDIHVIFYRLDTDAADVVRFGVYNNAEYRWIDGQFYSTYRLSQIGDPIFYSSSGLSNGDIYFISNKITNNYQGDTIINNEGDIIYNNPPSQDPDYDPYPDGGGTVTDPYAPDDVNNTDNLNFNFPNIDLDLPEIDWSIGDLSEKFPFSIPFDLYNMFSILNTEPQTPEIKGTIDLGIYEWSIDWDLHQFDDTAALLRNLEFVGFVIGLIFITRSIIKG